MIDPFGVIPGERYLGFRCTQCGNCCKDPLLPLTDADLRRIVEHTGDAPEDVVRWVDRFAIDMDDEPQAFVRLRQGRRVMVLRHQRGVCRYLGADDRCSIYDARPLGCRIFPFDPSFGRDGKLRRLRLIQATDCPHELDGKNPVRPLRSLHQRYQRATADYYEKVAEWNRRQRRQLRAGRSAATARQFLQFLGLMPAGSARNDATHHASRAPRSAQVVVRPR